MSEIVAVDATAETPKLQLLGDLEAEACEGEFCELPAHREQAVMNRRVDSDAV
jgi:hypothetical protein